MMSLLAVPRFGVGAPVDGHRAVAPDDPCMGSAIDRSCLAFRQLPAQHFARSRMLELGRMLVKIRRPDFETQARLFQHGSADFAVAGQYQRHSAPGEKSVEKSPCSPSAK